MLEKGGGWEGSGAAGAESKQIIMEFKNEIIKEISLTIYDVKRKLLEKNHI